MSRCSGQGCQCAVRLLRRIGTKTTARVAVPLFHHAAALSFLHFAIAKAVDRLVVDPATSVMWRHFDVVVQNR
jgi:hypothetical protein